MLRLDGNILGAFKQSLYKWPAIDENPNKGFVFTVAF